MGAGGGGQCSRTGRLEVGLVVDLVVARELLERHAVARHRGGGVDVAEVRGDARGTDHVEHGDVGDVRVHREEHAHRLPDAAGAAHDADLRVLGYGVGVGVGAGGTESEKGRSDAIERTLPINLLFPGRKEAPLRHTATPSHGTRSFHTLVFLQLNM